MKMLRRNPTYEKF